MNTDEYSILLACEKGNLSRVKRLVEKGTAVNFVCAEYDEEGDEDLPTALHVAVYNEHVELVLYLLSRGVSTTVGNNLGNTPLHVAARIRNREIYTILLSAGADSTIRNKKGKTPRQYL